ncbi:MAG: M64 family metallopeptidase [Candidatus Cryptobacteroides sp.]
MRTLHKIVGAFALIVGVLSSCTKETTLSVSTNSLFFRDIASSKTVDVSSNSDWSVTAPDWMRCEPSSGSGDGTVTVTITDDSGFSHSGTFTVSAGDLMESVSVKVSGVDFVITPEEFRFDESGTPKKAVINSNKDWSISVAESASWIQIEPMSGTVGTTEITLTPKPFTDRKPRSESIIDVTYGTSFTSFVVSQAMPNSAPEKTVLVYPGASGEVAIDAEFRWNAAKDADGDIITYTVMVTGDGGETWIETEVENATSTRLPELLAVNSDYQWKVIAADPFGGVSESDPVAFRTNTEGAWADYEMRVIREAKAGAAKPVNLVILGDGYTSSDFINGKKFDQDLDRAVTAFFSMEPYKTYADYFQVTAIAAYSEESGATVKANIPEIPGDEGAGGCAKQNRNTVFKTVLDGGGTTGITCSYNDIFQLVCEKMGVEYTLPQDGVGPIDEFTVILMVNLDVYAGTCVNFMTGRSVAMCPVGHGTFETIVNHECGGHGFARALDEYIYYSGYLDDSYRDQIVKWRTTDPDYACNIDLTGENDKVHWKHFFETPGYESVGLYEGSLLYRKGAWRPERISCMCDNRKYYNAPTREAIVRRIMKISGSEYSFEKFVAKDPVKSDNTGKEPPADYLQAMGYSAVLPPLAQPICVEYVD